MSTMTITIRDKRQQQFVESQASASECSNDEYVRLLIDEERALRAIEEDTEALSPEAYDAAVAREIERRREALRSGAARTVSEAEFFASHEVILAR